MLKSRILVLMIVSLFTLSACSQQLKEQNNNPQAVESNKQISDTKPAEAEKSKQNEVEADADDLKESIVSQELPRQPATAEKKPDFKPSPFKKYLLVNGIKVEPRSVAKELPEYNMRVDCPEIKGLADRKLQAKMNKELWEAAEKFINKPIPLETALKKKSDTQQRFEKWYSFSVNANYNNVLSLNIYTSEVYGTEYNEYKTLPLTFDMTTGKQLGLKDLFADGVDGIKMVNERIVSHLIRDNLEEWALCRPFQGISEDQPFSINEDILVINFDDRNSEFVYPSYQIAIPFSEFDGAIDIYDKYATVKEKLYEQEKFTKKMLNANFDIKWDFVRENSPEYNIWFQSAKFENMTNKDLEKKLNKLLGNIDLDSFRKTAVKAYNEASAKVASERNRNINVSARFGDALSIACYEMTSICGKSTQPQRVFLNYNTKTGKELKLKDLFNEGFDYKKTIRRNIMNQLGDRKIPESELPNLDAAIEKADFYFDEMAFHLVFMPGELASNIKDEAQFFNPYEEIGQENLSIFN